MEFTHRKGHLKKIHKLLVVAYFAYAVLPHAQLFTHSHSDGPSGHQHGFLSAHDAALGRESLAAIAESAGLSVIASHSHEIPADVAIPLEPGTMGFNSTGAAHQHTASISSLPVSEFVAFFILIPLAILCPMGLRSISIPDHATLNPSARGPPIFSC